MNFREWLMTESAKIKLAIFDFDSTLARTPEKPNGWVPPTLPGEKQSRGDWWSHPDSLSMPLWDGSFNNNIVAAFKEAQKDPSAHVVLLTGRNGIKTAPIIRQYLRKQGLHGKRVISPSHTKALGRHTDAHPLDDAGHEEYYKGDFRTEPDYPQTANGNPSDDTLDHKKYIVNRLMHNGITEINFYDDRDDHLPEFTRFFQELLGRYGNLQHVMIHHVKADGSIQEIPLKR